MSESDAVPVISDGSLLPTAAAAFVVDDEAVVATGMQEILARLWNGPIYVFNSAEAALARLLELKPELILMDIKLGNGLDGLAAAGEVLRMRPCPVVITTAYAEEEHIKQAVQADVFGYLVKPITGKQLSSTIILAQNRFAEFVRLREENSELLEALETRKMVERAKGILMERKNLPEKDAYDIMRTQSQRQSRSMREIAATIIQASDFL